MSHPATGAWPLARRSLRRAGRRTNAGLLLLTAGALLTGGLTFASGTTVWATLTTVAHGVLGLAIVALVPWKSVIIGRARTIPVTAWALLTLIVVCLVAGFVQFFAGFGALARLGLLAHLSPIQVHVTAALVCVPLLAWHVLRRRPQRLRRTDLSRRLLLRTGAFAVVAGAAYPVTAALARSTRGSAGRVATGSGRLAPDAIPATIWLLDRVPALDPESHSVDVDGRRLNRRDLAAVATPVLARLDCTSGWYAEATWSGARLSDLLTPVQLGSARSIVVTSVTGYTRRFDVAEVSSLWLATHCQEQLLTAETGSPVRLVAPHRRGFWWVKWVASVQLSSAPVWLQPPFPPQ